MDIVNTQTSGDQGMGTVVALDGGGYVVGWRGVAYGGQAIWFQRYDAEGAKVGAETWARDVAPAGQELPQLVAFEGGGFAVNGKYYDAGGIPTFGGGNATLAQQYGHTPEGRHLSENDPTIAGLPGGGYVTVEPKTADLNGYPGETLVVHWFNEAGQQQRQYERPLEPGDGATTATTSSRWPGVITLTDGKVLVTWHEDYRRADAAEFDLFSADGQLLRHEIVASRGGIDELDATPLPGGGFVVSWAGANYMASPEGYYQQYDAAGARVGEVVKLGPVAYGSHPIRVSLATTLENGDVVLVFEVRGPDGSADIAVQHLKSPAGEVEPPPPPPPTDEGQVITSPGPGATLNGGAGDDTLVASQGADVLIGNGGGDAFTFKTLPWAAGHVTDFTLGVDRLDLSAIFQTSGYAGSDPVADGRMRFDSDGAGGAKIYFDRDAPNAGDWPILITTLDNVSATGLTWAQLSGGGAPPSAEGNVLNSPGPGSTLQGGAGADTLNASQGPDQLTGGAGGDHFVFAKPPWNAGVVTDFATGSDKIDISALLDAYNGSNPMADGWLRLDDSGGSTKVYVDIDGPGGEEWPFLITTLQGVPPQA